MTQLFDTATYDASEDDPHAPAAPVGKLRRLRAVASTPDPQLSAQWRLDDTTIEIGRRGIAKARAALRDVSATIAPAVDESGEADAADDRPTRKAA